MTDRRIRVSHLLLAQSAVPLVAGGVRRFDVHGAWMLRAYALGAGAGTQVFVFLAAERFLPGPVHGLPRDLLMAAAWVLNLAVAEGLIHRASPRRRAGSRTEAGEP